MGERTHDPVVQTKQERRENDAVQSCHWTVSLLKRWPLGTHAGAVRDKHLQAYLDEFIFRHNRRKTKGTVRIAARVIQHLVAHKPMTMRNLIDTNARCRWFASDRPWALYPRVPQGQVIFDRFDGCLGWLVELLHRIVLVQLPVPEVPTRMLRLER